jgi:hypothetical protein
MADDPLEILAESMRAHGQSALLTEALGDRLGVELERLLGLYRAGTLTTEKLWAYVGVVDAFTSLEFSLRRKMNRAEAEIEKLTAGGLNG